MSVSDPYATPQDYRDRINRTDEGHDAEIYDQLVAVSRVIDKKLQRFFTKDQTVQARPFYPKGWAEGDPEAENPWFATGRSSIARSRYLNVDDIATTVGLIIKIDHARSGSFASETPLAPTDYLLFPLNADKGPEPQPWTRILLTSWGNELGWPPGSLVEVTAIWGWPAIPRAIREATVQITALRRLATPRPT